MTLEQWSAALGSVVVAAPAALVVLIGAPMLLGRSLGERMMARCTQTCVLLGLAASLAMLTLMLATGVRFAPIEFGQWVDVREEHFHFHLLFVFDRLSTPFVILTFVLVGAIGAFANRYLHREAGYARFFLFYAIFLLGMVTASLAGAIETLFVGWELVGLSSALLVAYFHDRPAPVLNGERVWAIYRIADAAFLIAAVVLHHVQGHGDFRSILGEAPWPDGVTALSPSTALLVGLLLLVAAAGKSALIPFSGWLPRAMEGPTPSSAIFYGALSVHLGTFLLLRVSPILDASLILRLLVIMLGAGSALMAATIASVQTDAKNALAYSSLTQVGVITVEIGLGWRYLALIHMIGHACLRTLQLLRAPSLLRDHQSFADALGGAPRSTNGGMERWLPLSTRVSLYRLAMARGELDAMLDGWIVAPFVRVFRWCDRAEHRWTEFLAGGAAHDVETPVRGAEGEP